jgi:hypothetical protein
VEEHRFDVTANQERIRMSRAKIKELEWVLEFDFPYSPKGETYEK